MQETLLHILTALGKSILHNLWQAGLLYVFFELLVNRTRHTPQQVSQASFVVLVLTCINFAGLFIYFLNHTQAGFSWITTGNMLYYNYAVAAVSLTYILALIPRIAGLWTSIRHLTAIRFRQVSKAPAQVRAFVAKHAVQLGISKKVNIFISSLVASPLTIGFLKPLILLPLSAITQLTQEQLQAVLLHELTHIKNRDYLKNFISEIIGTILYFNPFVKKLLLLQQLENEKIADEMVVNYEYNKYHYTTALLTLANRQNHALSVGATGKEQQLLTRVQWIFGDQKRKPIGAKTLLLHALSIITICILSVVHFEQLPASTNSIATQRPNPAFLMNTKAALSNEPLTEHIPAITATAKTKPVVVAAVTRETAQETATEAAITASPVNMTDMDLQPAFAVNRENEDQAKRTQTIALSKKVLFQTYWSHIETQLADAITAEEKTLLKEAIATEFAKSMDSYEKDLTAQKNNIDWETYSQQVYATALSLQLQKLYLQGKTELSQLKSIRKDSLPGDAIDKINHREKLVGKLLHTIDSIQHKKVVEL